MEDRIAQAGRCLAVLLLGAAAAVAQESERSGPAGRLRQVEIERQDVFSEEKAEANVFYGLANLLHGVTLADVISREIWFRPGEELTWEQIEELERNLRRLGIFGEVRADVRRLDNGDVDLLLFTRDRFSLGASASFASVGGVERLNFRLSEANLAGTGKEVVAAANYEEEDEHSAYLRYTDQQFLGTWHRFNVRVGETHEGPFGELALERPLRHLADPFGYGAEYAGAEEEVDYYRFGETYAEVPQERHAVRIAGVLASGPRLQRSSFIADLLLRHRDYEPATGAGAGGIRVPGDTDEVEVGGAFAVDQLTRFDKVQRLDSIDYVEDLRIGTSLRLRAAGRWRDEDGRGAELQPVLGLSASSASSPLPETWLTLALDGELRWSSDGLQGWQGSTALHAYQLSLPQQTLAGSLTFDLAGERQDLQPQLTLGEDNGLRGYPARELAGSRRVRLNLEDRIDTGMEVLSVRIGAVVFIDAGWVHDLTTDLSLGEAYRSVGFGLRLGSSHLFGSRVLRLDVAWPLDEIAGEDYGVSISFTSGQVFTFFGNATELGSAF